MRALKVIGCAAVAAVLAMSALTGCSKGEQTVSTDGSTSMEKVIGFLSEAYMEKHEDVKVTYNPTGSGSGIKAVESGSCDIAIVVNSENPVADLTVEQIAKLYTGEVTNWKDVGGSDAPVVCIGREAASGTRDGFESITDTKEKCKYNQELTSTGDVIQTVSSNPNAIGYASLASVGDTVKTVSVEGVTPTNGTILNGEYKIQRNFVLVTKKGAELKGAAKDFFDFCLSKDGATYIEKAGAVPVAK